MTIWIDGLGDEARWTLRHHSIATTNAAGIDSEGDYLYRASTEFIIPIIIGTFAVSKLRNRALDAAGVGPMWGLAPWIVLITVLSGFVLIGMFGSFAELFVHLPLILAVYVTAIIGVVLLESD